MTDRKTTQRTSNGPRPRMVALASCALLSLALTGTFCSLSGARAATVEREGQRYEDALRVGKDRLVLNGIGVRTVAWFKGYVAALYLPQKTHEAEAVYALPGSKRIAVRMLIDIDAATLAKTLDDGIRKNYKGEQLEPLQARMETLGAQIRSLESVKKGEEVDLDCRNGSTVVSVRGKPIGEPIEGDDFYVALLKMFIGERAVDKNLRTALLGAADGSPK